jgi:hypothetical protein
MRLAMSRVIDSGTASNSLVMSRQHMIAPHSASRRTRICVYMCVRVHSRMCTGARSGIPWMYRYADSATTCWLTFRRTDVYPVLSPFGEERLMI